jgi:hypothetical protein
MQGNNDCDGIAMVGQLAIPTKAETNKSIIEVPHA